MANLFYLHPLVVTWVTLLISIGFNMSGIYVVNQCSCTGDHPITIDDSSFSEYYPPEREAFLMFGA